jgi:hypothetical protein
LKVALLRVGIDSGSGGMDGPLFTDGSFEYVPIPDSTGLDERTYGNCMARTGRPLSDFFPLARQAAMSSQSIHLDPEFTSFTYGDPTSPKAGLRRLATGDLLVFYAGLRGYGCDVSPGVSPKVCLGPVSCRGSPQILRLRTGFRGAPERCVMVVGEGGGPPMKGKFTASNPEALTREIPRWLEHPERISRAACVYSTTPNRRGASAANC